MHPPMESGKRASKISGFHNIKKINGKRINRQGKFLETRF